MERCDGDEDGHETLNATADGNLGSGDMDVDEQDLDGERAGTTDEIEDGDGDDDDDPSDVAMVPMADILNARYQTENVSTVCDLCSCQSPHL